MDFRVIFSPTSIRDLADSVARIPNFLSKSRSLIGLRFLGRNRKMRPFIAILTVCILTSCKDSAAHRQSVDDGVVYRSGDLEIIELDAPPGRQIFLRHDEEVLTMILQQEAQGGIRTISVVSMVGRSPVTSYLDHDGDGRLETLVLRDPEKKEESILYQVDEGSRVQPAPAQEQEQLRDAEAEFKALFRRLHERVDAATRDERNDTH